MPSISIKINGLDSLTKKLQALGKAGQEELDKGINDIASKIRDDAKLLISRGARTGKFYKQNKAGGVHQASAQGEPPKSWSGALVAQITAQRHGVAHYDVGSRAPAPHGLWLEMGTAHTKPRKWLGPTYKKNLQYIEDRIRKAAELAIRRASGGS